MPASVHDPARLAAVERSGLVDSEAEEPFDRLATMAALLLDSPMAFVTVVDHRRSWYKSAIGLPPGACRSRPVEESFCQYVVGNGEPLLVDDARADPRTCANPAIESMGVAAWAGYPVHAPSGEVLGTLCVVDTSPHTWSARDSQVLEALSRAASSEIGLRSALDGERVARMDAEAAADALSESRDRLSLLARALQQSLLPPELPKVPGMEVAATYVPAATGEEVVGDFYDVFQGARGTWCILLGDVCGKGPEAATITAMARYTLRAAAVRSTSPSKVLATLNAALLQQRQEDDERFLTVAYASLRRRNAKLVLSLCSAGHPPPLIRRAQGTVESACPPSLPLGLFDGPALRDVTIELAEGDALVFYSDGVTEARSGNVEFGLERLLAAVQDSHARDAACLVSELAAAVSAFRDGPPRDDTAILVATVAASTHP